jgi:poly-gamma-glutamate synthesis protein (capsule biosynthesis protein)
LIFGGDVMLGRSCAAKIQNGSDPFENISGLVSQASFAAANLECTISNVGRSTNRYAFRAPNQSAVLLRRAGFDAMGLANNHALDFGTVALYDSAARLVEQEIEPVGVETPRRKACDPTFFCLPGGKKIALLAINDVGEARNDGFPAVEVALAARKPSLLGSTNIATASDRAKFKTAITYARSHADLTICLIHWGIENSDKITDEQRELARWLIDRGVDLVVGSHPHCVQSIDFYHGRPIAYSLGNLVFDGAPTIASWNRGALLEVGLDEDAKISSVSLIPVVLKDGFPRVDATPERRLVDALDR